MSMFIKIKEVTQNKVKKKTRNIRKQWERFEEISKNSRNKKYNN